MKVNIGIKAWGSVSPLGGSAEEVKASYHSHQTCIKWDGLKLSLSAALNDSATNALQEFKDLDHTYKKCDPTVLMALASSSKALSNAGWQEEKDLGVFIGSSRGAAEQLEKNHERFLNDEAIHPLTSPLTTMGNISAIVARHFRLIGFNDTISMTCSSSFHALMQGIVWIQSGMKDKMLVGGTEAPLTSFFIQQLKSLGLYAEEEAQYPNRSLDMDKSHNSMVLGEGSACFAIEAAKDSGNYPAIISGIGYGMESAPNIAGVSRDGQNAQIAMKEALEGHDPESMDCIVMHAPGTIKGDQSELNAVKAVFGNNVPLLTSNKWKIGHSLGASGALSLEMAILMLQEGRVYNIPFVYSAQSAAQEPEPKKIMINTLGFGGNAISIIIEKQ